MEKITIWLRRILDYFKDPYGQQRLQQLHEPIIHDIVATTAQSHKTIQRTRGANAVDRAIIGGRRTRRGHE